MPTSPAHHTAYRNIKGIELARWGRLGLDGVGDVDGEALA